jgi:TonB family protein
VQTGGFGDPNGVTPRTNNTHGTIAAARGFTLPSGTGVGTGAGGSHGARGAIASAGFGDAIVSSAAGEIAGHLDQVEQTQFAAPAVATSTAPKRAVIEQVRLTPVAIQSKPNPLYTDEARRMRIEGEILVNVVFTAAGEVHIVGVLKGLGHGLDEAAVRAAQRIKFTPAERGGQRVDYPATLRIVFALS